MCCYYVIMVVRPWFNVLLAMVIARKRQEGFIWCCMLEESFHWKCLSLAGGCAYSLVMVFLVYYYTTAIIVFACRDKACFMKDKTKFLWEAPYPGLGDHHILSYVFSTGDIMKGQVVKCIIIYTSSTILDPILIKIEASSRGKIGVRFCTTSQADRALGYLLSWRDCFLSLNRFNTSKQTSSARIKCSAVFRTLSS